jgi:hypothetical protein
MDECERRDAGSCGKGPGRGTGEGVGGLEMTAGVDSDASICMRASVSTVDIDVSGMTLGPSESVLKIRFTAMIPAAPVSALRSAPT